MTIDTQTAATTIVGALILWYLKDNTETGRKLREEVVILKTQLEFIKAAVQLVPTLKENTDKFKSDLNEYFTRLKKIERKIGFDEKDS